jgi:hypothetical protein
MKELSILDKILYFIKYRIPCYFGKHFYYYTYDDGFRCMHCDKNIPNQNK